MLQAVFGGMLGAAVLFGLISGRGDVVFQGFLQGAKDGVMMALALAGSLAVFGGLMHILSVSGLESGIRKRLKRPLRLLMGEMPDEAMGYVALNLSANVLGLGNAATPAGIKAAKILAEGERASNALCMFLVINTSSVQLLPATVISMRAVMGAANPEAVILPGLLSTAFSTAVGILLCKWMEKRK